MTPRGAANPAAKLAEDQARAIRERYARGESIQSLGRAFGIDQSQAYNVAVGRSWRHLGPPPPGVARRRWNGPGERNPRATIADARAAELVERYWSGEPVAALAREAGVSREHLWRIATGRRRRTLDR